MFETLMNAVIDMGKEVVKDYVNDAIDEFVNYKSDGTDMGDSIADLTDSVKDIMRLFR